MATTLPTVKIEGDENVKMEDASSPSAASDAYMDDADDDPELNFEEVNRILWISKLPRYLWEALATAADDEEIEIGTIRVEGPFDNPERVSLMLSNSDKLPNIEKEFVLKKQQTAPKPRRPGQALMFSEKNRPGYKQKTNVWDMIDEDGNPGQGRSQLYEQAIRDEKKKENKGRYTPYLRKPIPKITALAGTVHQEFEAIPVDNDEYRKLDQERTRTMLKTKEKENIEIKTHVDPLAQYASVLTAAERQDINKAAQRRRQDAKDNRAARLDKTVVLQELFKLFREHKYWGLRDLRIRLRQPESWVKENLEEIAVMHRHGDFNGKWELKDTLKTDDGLLNASGEAPKAEDSDIDMKSEDDDFEDV